MKCRYRGAEIKNEKARFCFSCGNTIEKNNEVESYVQIEKKKIVKKDTSSIIKIDNDLTEKEKKQKKKIKKNVLMFLLIFFVFDVALGIGVYIKNQKRDNTDKKADMSTEVVNTTEEKKSEVTTTGTTEEITTEEIVSDGDAIYIYSYNDEFGNYLQFFYDKYPEYEDKVIYKVVGDGWGDRYINDLSAAYNSYEPPSIVIYDVDYIGYLFDTDRYYSLDEIGITADMCADMYPFTIDAATYDGKLMGFSWQACPRCFCYRMDIAEQVFGLSDPDVIGEYFSTWDGVLNAGEMLKNAGYYLVPETTGVIRSMGNNYNSDVINAMINNGYSKELVEWSADWQAGFDSDIFGYFGCTWFGSVIGYGSSSGNVGICTAPEAYYWGGSYLGVTRECPNTELAKLVIYTLYCDSDVMYEMGLYSGWDLPNNLSSIQRMIDNGDEPWDHNIIGTKGVLDVYYDISKKSELRTSNQVTCYLTDIAINNEQDDYYTNLQSVSKSEERYYHFAITGIIDNKGVNVSYCVHYSDGSSEWGKFDEKFYNNDGGSVSVTCYSAGIESIEVYVDYGDGSDSALIGTMSIQITD